jgi:hypothetical protein
MRTFLLIVFLLIAFLLIAFLLLVFALLVVILLVVSGEQTVEWGTSHLVKCNSASMCNSAIGNQTIGDREYNCKLPSIWIH